MANIRFGLEIEADGIDTTLAELNTLQSEIEGVGAVSVPGDQFVPLNQSIGATKEQLDQLIETFDYDGAAPLNLPTITAQLAALREQVDATADDFSALQEASGLTADEFAQLDRSLAAIEKRNTDDLARLASTLGTNLGGAKKFADSLGLTAAQASTAAARMRELKNAGATQEETMNALSRELGITADQYGSLSTATETATAKQKTMASQMATGFGEGIGAITKVAFSINEIVAAGQTLLASLGPVYDFLIGQNERLNQQLLSSQTNIASSANISLGGVEVTDPTAKIQASQGALKQALVDLEEQTKSLVGVTDGEIQELFQITLQSASDLTGQSKEFGNSIESATALTTGLAATMGTLGIPLDQARQEINSIIKGQITSDSMVAKSLNINNAMVAEWKSQGVLVDKLNEKLEVFKAGNALAADSVGGVTSNIESLFQKVGREIGADLLAPMVERLNGVYEFLAANEGKFIEFGQGVAEAIGQTFSRLEEALGGLVAGFGDMDLDTIFEMGSEGLEYALSLIEDVGKSLISIGEVLLPIVMGQIAAARQWMPMISDIVGGIAVTIQGIAVVLKPVAELLGATIAGVAMGANALYQGAEDAIGFLMGSTGESKEAVEAYSRSTNQLLDESTKRTADLKAAIDAKNAADAAGIPLTQEQAKAAAIAAKQSNLTLDALKAQRLELDEAAITGSKNREAVEGQKAALDEQIEALEGNIDALGDYSGELELSAKQADSLGTAAEQLAEGLKGAQDTLAKGTGTTEELDAAAKTAIDNTQQMMELGQLSADAAIENLQQIATNTQLSADQQLKAEEEITKIKEEELQTRLKDFELAQAEIERDIERGRVDAIEGEKSLTESKIAALDEEMAARKERLAELEDSGRGDTAEAKELIQNMQELEGERQEIALESAEKISALRLEKLAEEQEKTLELLTKSEIEQQNALKRLQLEGLAGKSEVDELKLKQEEERLNEELKLSKENQRAQIKEAKTLLAANIAAVESSTQDEATKRKEISELRKNFAKDNAELERQLAIEQAELEGGLLDNQIAKEEAARAKILEQMETLILTQQAGDNAHLAALDESEASLNRQSDLRQQQAALLSAQNALEQDIAQNRIAGFDRALGAQQEIAGFADAQLSASEAIANQQEKLKGLAEGIVAKQLEVNSATSAREAILMSQIEKEEEGSDKRLALERDLQAATRARATERLGLERELAKITGNQSGVIAAQIALSKEGSQQRLALEKRLLIETEKERKASAAKEIEDARNKIEEEKKAIAEAQKQAEIAAAQEKQRREELAALGVGENASDVDIIKAKQAAEDQLARQKLDALRAEQQQQQIALEIEIQRNELAARRAELAANASVLQAQQNRLEAESALAADPNNERLKAQLALAMQGVELAEQGVKAAQEDAQAQAQAAANQRELLALQQQSALQQAQQGEETRQLDQARELAAAGVKDATAIATANDLTPENFKFEIPKIEIPPIQIPTINIPPIQIPEFPPLEIAPDNPIVKGLDQLIEEFGGLSALLADAKPPNIVVNVDGGSGGGSGRASIQGAGL